MTTPTNKKLPTKKPAPKPKAPAPVQSTAAVIEETSVEAVQEAPAETNALEYEAEKRIEALRVAAETGISTMETLVGELHTVTLTDAALKYVPGPRDAITAVLSQWCKDNRVSNYQTVSVNTWMFTSLRDARAFARAWNSRVEG